MKSINITRGSSHRLKITLSRYGLPMAITQSNNVEVSVQKVMVGRKIVLEHTLSATHEGVVEFAVPAILTAGRYDLAVTGYLDGEGAWRLSAAAGITVSESTEKGDETLTVQGDSYDVTATIEVMQGTSGSEEELREMIAEIIDEEYNASERIRENKETERQEAEGRREEACRHAVEEAERVNATIEGTEVVVTDRYGVERRMNLLYPPMMTEQDTEEMMARIFNEETD